MRFFLRESFEVYRAKSQDYLSAHSLADFRRCPVLYRKKQLGLIPDRDSSAFLVGRAAHTLILEGRERFEAEYAVGGPINPRTGQPYGTTTKAFAEWAERIGKPVLDDSQAAIIEEMASSVHNHTEARRLLEEGVAEVVVRLDGPPMPRQARIDWVHPTNGIVDLKTCDNLDRFEDDIARFEYIHQLAFYSTLLRDAIMAENGIHDPGSCTVAVHIISVEKREPYRCGVWRVCPSAIKAAQAENDRAINELIECLESGHWPTRYEGIRTYPPQRGKGGSHA